METPVCTVIIPTRNGLAHLPNALDSVWSQGAAVLEIIVVDDGSTDGTADWLAAEASRRPALRVLQGGGCGPSHARNRALTAARGDLVAFLDDDDRWLTGKLDTQIAFHRQQPDTVFSFTDYRHVGPDGGDRGTAFAHWPLYRPFVGMPNFARLADAPATLLAENAVGTSTVMARSNAMRAVGGFQTDLLSAEDWEQWLRLARLGPVALTGRVLADYSMRPGSVSSNATCRLDAMQEILRRHGHAAADVPGWAVRRASARILTGRAELARAEGRSWHAFVRHCAALALAPSPRALRAALADARDGLLQPLTRTTLPWGRKC